MGLKVRHAGVRAKTVHVYPLRIWGVSIFPGFTSTKESGSLMRKNKRMRFVRKGDMFVNHNKMVTPVISWFVTPKLGPLSIYN